MLFALLIIGIVGLSTPSIYRIYNETSWFATAPLWYYISFVVLILISLGILIFFALMKDSETLKFNRSEYDIDTMAADKKAKIIYISKLDAFWEHKDEDIENTLYCKRSTLKPNTFMHVLIFPAVCKKEEYGWYMYKVKPDDYDEYKWENKKA
jgi:hypothetical protein